MKALYSLPGAPLALTACLFLFLLATTRCTLVDEPEEPSGSGDLSALQGDWYLVGGNNPDARGMHVAIDDDEGTVVNPALTSLNVGDIKWRNIRQTGDDRFEHEELGSDRNYYPATMEIVGDTALEVRVQAAGAGNIQSWRRNPPPLPVTELEANYFSQGEDRTLVNTAAPIDYRVPRGTVMDITVKVTIEPGVVIEFEENAGFGVYDSGSLNAVGTADRPIVFQGASAIKGYWRGIHMESNSTSNHLRHVTIRHAGSNYVYCCNEAASLFLKDGQQRVEDVTIEDGDANGIVVRDEVELEAFKNLTIRNHDEYPIMLQPLNLNAFDPVGSSLFDNDEPYVYVYRGPFSMAIIWPSGDQVRYLVEGRVLDVSHPLTIEPGTEILFEEDGGLGVYDEGTFNAVGTAEQPIVLRGKEPVAGYWRGIHLETNSTFNQLEHVQIADAGANYVYCCNPVASLYLKDGQAELANVSISNGAAYGIATGKDFIMKRIDQTDIGGHEDYPVYVSAEQLDAFSAGNYDFSGNEEEYIYVYRSSIGRETRWYPCGLPFLVENVLDITRPLTIEPGTEVAFAENAGLGIYDDGSINAVGTTEARIRFFGRQEVPGYWRGIHVETNSVNNRFEYVDLSHGGSNYVYCCNEPAGLLIKRGQFTLRNSFIFDNQACGVFIIPNAEFVESGNTFSNNEGGNICL